MGGVADANFTLVQLRYFVTAAELGSMTAASRELMVAQSAISAAIAQVERELGVQLLIRHHARGLSLTRAGERFLVEAREFLAHAAALAQSARGLAGSLTGELAVGCLTTLAPFYLSRLLREFAGRYPGVRVSVAEGELSAMEAALLDGRCEVALVYAIDLALDLDIRPLTQARPYALLPLGHPLAEAEAVSLADLATEPMILLDLPRSRDYFRAIYPTEPRVRFRTSSYETARSLVAGGHGYSILNQRADNDQTYDGGRVACVPISDDVPALDVVLASVRGVRPTARAVAFAETCQAFFSGRRPGQASGG
ncbi:LysR substrate-binding domain-containing protein [Microbispora triticiradicis]|uniref:LysR substrate-binding domain-containing protein n=1 Tax=Microbispora triticiradicis TaxID=2200763 RepID=UPI001AD695C5|nr:LysR substrate-binding domain-containing protein [Microbispora triticiradicis]MBO4270038.1 LysR family transcriptional regulator [Microbispora triticiradicis]